jgi:hypothetical protein
MSEKCHSGKRIVFRAHTARSTGDEHRTLLDIRRILSIRKPAPAASNFGGLCPRARLVQGRSLASAPGEEPGLVQLRAAWRWPLLGQPLNPQWLAQNRSRSQLLIATLPSVSWTSSSFDRSYGRSGISQQIDQRRCVGGGEGLQQSWGHRRS